MRIVLPLAAALLAAMPAAAADLAPLKQEAAGLIKQYAGTLQGELKAAMQAGGPTEAIAVCNAKAPAIAAELSRTSGWDIGRTSHRIRNPDSAPDAWERAVLDDFLARLGKGEPAERLVRAEIVDDGGARVFRMAKAIPVQEVCLNCHGAELAPAVTAALAEHYPADAATGFAMGDIRGVFTLKKPM